VTTGYLIYCDF